MNIVLRFGPQSFPTPEAFAQWIRVQLRLVAQLNLDQLSAGWVPCLYKSGAVYIREPPGVESFVDAYTCWKAGGGDCAHLSAWLLGELWLTGDSKADINVKWFPRGATGRLFHVRVRNGQGTILDPSKKLGM